MMKNIRNILILFVALALSATIVAQAQDGETKPSLVVFVVGMESNETGDFLAILIGNELSGGSFEVITRTDVVQKKLRELREYEQSGNVNESELIEWGRQNNVSMLCLVTSIKLDEHMYAAQLTDVKSNKLVGSADYISPSLSSAELKKAAESLSSQLQGKGGGTKSGGTAQSSGKKNGDIYNPDGIELVYVEGTGRALGVQSFFIGKYEVTQAHYEQVMGSNPSYYKAPNKPVEKVSWHDAQEFLRKLNAMTGRTYRLPTAKEWMYAANGGLNNDKYEYAGSNSIDGVAWYVDNSGDRTHPVGTKSPNSIGVYDMSGNVFEWCQDSDGSNRVNCGGAYFSLANDCSVAYRGNDSPDHRYYSLGFRVVLSLQSE